MEYINKEIDLNEKDFFRFSKYIGEEKENGCIEWQAFRFARGYGCFGAYRNGKSLLAHRVAFWLSGQDLINGMVIDHICQNTSCINPAHLRQVTQKINMTENSRSMGAVNKAKTHCKRGHELAGDNLVIRISKKGSGRNCKICLRFLSRRWGQKKRIADAEKRGTTLRRQKRKAYDL